MENLMEKEIIFIIMEKEFIKVIGNKEKNSHSAN
jgi:hypothetical protein